MSFSEPPSSPENLTLVGVTSRSARLLWSGPAAKPKIERFVIQWKRQQGKCNIKFAQTETEFILYRKWEKIKQILYSFGASSDINTALGSYVCSKSLVLNQATTWPQ
jgi:hypothetical protein